jgi:hypothetical protein
MEKIEQCCTGKYDETGYLEFNWALGRASNNTKVEGRIYFIIFFQMCFNFVFVF